MRRSPSILRTFSKPATNALALHALRRFPAVLTAWLLLFAGHASAQDPFQTIHRFTGETDPRRVLSLLQAADGSLYGTTADGGTQRLGVVFKITPGGSYDVLYSFGDGVYASQGRLLLQTSDGTIFFVADAPQDRLYRLSPDGSVNLVAAAVSPYQLIEARDGNLYGLGFIDNQAESFFRISHDGTAVSLHSFPWDNEAGICPTSLLQGTDGNFYGTHECGKGGLGGTLFKLTAGGDLTILHQFANTGLIFPGSLVEGPGGALFGTADLYNTSRGAVYKFTAAGEFSVLHTFSDTDIGSGVWLRSFDGSALHGYAHPYDGTDRMTLFKMSSDGTVTSQTQFQQMNPIVQGMDGFWYGARPLALGTAVDKVLRLDMATGTSATVHEFSNGSAASRPTGPLVEAAGRLYGTTSSGGSHDKGTVFRATFTGDVTVLHEFTGGPNDGAYPAALISGSDGNLYGVTAFGGAHDIGTVFRISPAGAFDIIYSFTGVSDGRNPYHLLQGSDGFLYGMVRGTSSYVGSIFRLNLAGSLSLLHTFGTGVSDRGWPSTLIQGRDGSLYGTTALFYEGGIAFRLLTDGTYIPLHIFDGPNEGYMPLTLFEANDGYFYGATGCHGTIFKMTPGGDLTVLSDPNLWLCDDDGGGYTDYVAFAQRPEGGLYGVRLRMNGSDDLFTLSSEGVITSLHTFTDNEGSASLIRSSGGNLYGTTVFGGPSRSGTLFRYRLRPESLIYIDQPTTAQVVVEPFVMSGWALDATDATGSGVDAIHAWAYPNPGSGQAPVFVGVATIGRPRPDVGAYFGNQFAASGFELAVHGLAPGPYQFIVFTHHTMTASFDDARVVNVTIAPNAPMAIDSPVQGATVVGSVRLSGWAVDRAAASGTGVSAVHVWAYPNPGSGQAPFLVGAASYGGARPDVGAIFGNQFTNSAYDLTVSGLKAGDYQFVVFAYSTVSQSFSSAMTVTVHALASQAMAVDVPLDGATVSGSFTISGWAIDRAAASGPGVDAVHVWAYPNPGSGQPPILLGAATYGGARPDVGAAFGGQFTNSAFTFAAPALAPGTYQLVIFARSRMSGSFDNARVVRVVVPAR